jgi:hypothetical protein
MQMNKVIPRNAKDTSMKGLKALAPRMVLNYNKKQQT